MMTTKRISIIIALLAITVGGCAIWLLFFTKEPNISLTLAPSVANVEVDKAKKVKQGNLYFAPGKHTFVVSMAGFATQQFTVNIPANGKASKTIILIPNSQVGYDWLTNHPDEATRREGFGGAQFSQESKDRSKSLPLITQLPHIDNFYRVDYGVSKNHPTSSTAVAIYVTYYSEDGKQQAIDWLKFKGYTDTNTEIIYQPSGIGNE